MIRSGSNVDNSNQLLNAATASNSVSMEASRSDDASEPGSLIDSSFSFYDEEESFATAERCSRENPFQATSHTFSTQYAEDDNYMMESEDMDIRSESSQSALRRMEAQRVESEEREKSDQREVLHVIDEADNTLQSDLRKSLFLGSQLYHVPRIL